MNFRWPQTSTSKFLSLHPKFKEPWNCVCVCSGFSYLHFCQGSRRPGHYCKSLGSKFASGHNSLRNEMWNCDSLALSLRHSLECSIKGCFLTRCFHWACMHALAWCFCNFYVASAPQSEGANKALIQIAVRTVGSCPCQLLTSPASWVIIHHVNCLPVPSMYIINGRDYPRKFSSHK